MEHLQDRVAVVTGAASGLGLAMSERFAAAGMKVVLADIEAERLDAAVRGLRAAGHDATAVVTDVADADAVNHLAAAAFDTYGVVPRPWPTRRLLPTSLTPPLGWSRR